MRSAEHGESSNNEWNVSLSAGIVEAKITVENRTTAAVRRLMKGRLVEQQNHLIQFINRTHISYTYNTLTGMIRSIVVLRTICVVRSFSTVLSLRCIETLTNRRECPTTSTCCHVAHGLHAEISQTTQSLTSERMVTSASRIDSN